MAIPATPTRVKNLWVLTLKFNAPKINKGWAERYIVDVAEDLPGASPALVEVAPNLASFINFRLVVLGLGCEMFSAALSTTTGGTDAKPLLFQPGQPIALASESPIGGANMGGDGFQFQTVCPSRKKAMRPLLGVRDTWIAAMANTVDISGWDPAAYVLPGSHTGQTAAEALQSWMKLLLTKTARGTWKDGAYVIEKWDNVQFKRTISRRLGASFG